MLNLSLTAKFLILLLLVIGLLLAQKSYTLYQAVSPSPIAFWQISNEHSHQQINHQLWQDILTTYLVDLEQGRTFNYRDVSPRDQQKLSDYLNQLQSIDPQNYNKNEQLAYWINLYNALTVNLILNHYPIASIKDIGDGFTGPWNIPQLIISGQQLSLNQIEHKILRAIWQDPRIHYVINCASTSCPDLGLKAFSSSHIEQQLDHAATRFINQTKGVRFSHQTLILSSIYHWFSDDFGADQAELLKHINHYARPSLQQQLKNYQAQPKFSYQWQLNQQRTEP